MKKSEPPYSEQHPQDLLLLYVENLLTEEEKAEVDDHLKGCSRCSSEAESIRRTTDILKKTKEAFCPEPWKLYEHIHYGRDLDPTVARHPDQCSACREIVEAWALESSAETIPTALLEKIRARRSHEHEMAVPRLSVQAALAHFFSRLLRAPALAAGAVAAAVLMAVLLYPSEIPQSLMAPTSVTWEGTPRPKSFEPSANRLAMLIAFKDFDRHVQQAEVDTLYRALAPTMELYERFQVVPPKVVKDAAQKGWSPPRDRTELLVRLKKKLNISHAVIVTITSRADHAEIQVELIDAESGKVKAEKTEPGVSEKELERAVRQSALSVMLSARPQKGGAN